MPGVSPSVALFCPSLHPERLLTIKNSPSQWFVLAMQHLAPVAETRTPISGTESKYCEQLPAGWRVRGNVSAYGRVGVSARLERERFLIEGEDEFDD